jgi:hypothetical protein
MAPRSGADRFSYEIGTKEAIALGTLGSRPEQFLNPLYPV